MVNRLQTTMTSQPSTIAASPGVSFTPRQMLWQVAKKYPLKIIASIITGFSGALFNGIGTALVVPIMLSLLGQDAILKDGPPIFQMLLAPFQGLPETYRYAAMALAALLLIVLKNASNYLSALASGMLSRAMTSDLQRQGLDMILSVDLEYFGKAQVGELVNRLGGEMNRAATAITATIRLFVTVATVLVFLGILLSISWQLTIVATLLLPISSLVVQILVKRTKHYSRAFTRLNSLYSGGLVELISGIRLVKSVVAEDREYERFAGYINEREDLNLKIQMNSGIVNPLGEVLNISVLFILILLARWLFQDQLASLAAVMVTYLVLLNRLLPYISQVNSGRNQLAQVSASVDIVHNLLRTDNKSFMQNGAISYSGLNEGIEFRNVCFHYPDVQNPVLQNINLKLPKGTTLALVGSSGAGKSTLADLVPRFFDPTAGQILVDGQDLKSFNIAQIRKAMGIVGQETFLFNNTVRYNLAYGNFEATDAEILDAAKRANAYDFIMNLPEGLDTMIGDRGVMLSGGQRQRLAIARALVQNPEILILDEATSALDTVSERLVQEAIDELSRDRTTLVIAHRLSTVRKADQIAVMASGQVVELGTHESLIKQNGTYSKLCQLQFQDENSEQDRTSQQIAETSYKFRSNLNNMTGLLSILEYEEDETEHASIMEKILEMLEEMLQDLEKVEGGAS
ncbi:ABC transporter ATP-binding protein [Leptolyngbya iicbica]|uniref:ABC transporter ATP-binding protein n=1 Tax=Leptolyngbya iicbica TaxID=3161580 RepID=UPI000AA05ADF|nr:ABC transporter ATP-binding protein [Leptolyngbya sp. LK]